MKEIIMTWIDGDQLFGVVDYGCQEMKGWDYPWVRAGLVTVGFMDAKKV